MPVWRLSKVDVLVPDWLIGFDDPGESWALIGRYSDLYWLV